MTKRLSSPVAWPRPLAHSRSRSPCKSRSVRRQVQRHDHRPGLPDTVKDLDVLEAVLEQHGYRIAIANAGGPQAVRNGIRMALERIPREGRVFVNDGGLPGIPARIEADEIVEQRRPHRKLRL